MKGYLGKVLLIDLGSATWKEEAIDEAVYENLLSGVGLGAYYLYRNIPAGADPLGPDNILGFTSGLLTGTGSVMTGRWMAVCKSPLTGGWGDSNCGGTLSIAIKQCGYDAIFVKGVSSKPVYVFIDNKGPEIRDASAYWGLDAVEAEEALVRDQSGKKKAEVAVIGPAGEKLSLIAGISNDRGRYAARSGVGAVMGSKRLKALVLAGSKAVRGVDSQGLKELSKEYSRKIRRANAPGFFTGSILPVAGRLLGAMKDVAPMDGMLTTMLLKKFGSIMNNTMAVENGDAPIKNWGGSKADYGPGRYRGINPDRFRARETRKYHCYSCVVGCGGTCRIADLGKGEFAETHKPEYETAMAFGGLLLNRDPESILYINELLNRGGMDSISAGGTVAFAIECFEAGILTAADTGGLELRWGDSRAVIELVRLMLAREGIGDLLADGVRRAAERLGKGSERFAVHAGGQELPMHDPKIDPMLGTTYSADPTPGRHTTSGGLYYSMSFLWDFVSWAPRVRKHPKSEDYEATEVEALKNKAMTSFKMLVDGSGGCYYAMIMGAQHFRVFEYLNRATGWTKTPDEYMEIGTRMQTMRQMFNAKQGVDLRGIRMHDRAAGIPPLAEGHNRGLSLKLDGTVPLFWKAWGWDVETGRPSRETFSRLGLDSRLGLEYCNG
jgi:aldehyde:ferredoxin oxidoreductase